jgi:hypothetical protein
MSGANAMTDVPDAAGSLKASVAAPADKKVTVPSKVQNGRNTFGGSDHAGQPISELAAATAVATGLGLNPLPRKKRKIRNVTDYADLDADESSFFVDYQVSSSRPTQHIRKVVLKPKQTEVHVSAPDCVMAEVKSQPDMTKVHIQQFFQFVGSEMAKQRDLLSNKPVKSENDMAKLNGYQSLFNKDLWPVLDELLQMWRTSA